jgi:signal transduction histidine kinase
MGAASASDVTGQLAGTALPAAFAPLIEQYRMTPEAQSEITVGTGENQRHFEMRISPIRNRQDELTGRLFVVHEITALKQASAQIQGQNERLTQINQELAVAREQAEESNRLKSEFLATMSHELRTPLNSVIGYTDVMLTGLVGSFTEKQTDYLKRVMANGERLLSLINDILDISKIEAGRLELVQHAYNLQDLLNGVKAQMQSLAEQKSLPFNTYFDPLLPVEVVGDPKRLEQILINLVSNAIRFTDTGSVEIRFEKIDSASWALLVRDTGSGIPPHALEYIFDEFRQVDMSTHREHGGTGLGLSIVRKLVILMNGTIQVQSEVGKGSVFRVQLPLIVPEVQVVH